MRHTISVLVENEFGVLARVAGMFSGRGFNIESLAVAETMDPTVSCITLVTAGDDTVLEQITKQLNKLVSVIRVSDFKDTAHVERELVLIKVKADERTRGELMHIVDIFRGKIIDVGPHSHVVEVTGPAGQDRRHHRALETPRHHRDRADGSRRHAARHADARRNAPTTRRRKSRERFH